MLKTRIRKPVRPEKIGDSYLWIKHNVKLWRYFPMAWLKQYVVGKQLWVVLATVLVLLRSTPVVGADPDVLKIGVRKDCPPFSYYDESTNTYHGYSVDLCLEIARNAQANLSYRSYKFIPVTAQNRFEKLYCKNKEDKIDILCEATTVTQERMRKFGSTIYTFISGASLMYSSKIYKEPKINVGVLKGTTTENEVRKILDRQTDIDRSLSKDFSKIIQVDTHLDGLKQFLEEKINLYIADREILLALSRRAGKKNQQLIVSKNYYTIEPYALFTRADDHELRYIANMTLSEIFKTDIQLIFNKNFPGKRMNESLRQIFRLQQLLHGSDPLKDKQYPCK